VGEQLSEVGVTGTTRLIVAAFEMLFSVAVMVAAWVLLRAVVVALKVAEVEPVATATDAGTVRAAFVLISATEEAPAGAA
jgi:hypothetical protein